MQSRPDLDDLLAGVHGDGDFPAPGAQSRLQFLQHRQVGRKIGQLPLALQRVVHPAKIPRRIVHIGLLHLHIMQTDNGMQLDRTHIRFLAHDLAMHLAGGRHVDDNIGQYLCRAGQAATLGQRLAARVAHLRLAEWRQALF